jgi:hypothetical protein
MNSKYFITLGKVAVIAVGLFFLSCEKQGGFDG